MSGDFVPPKSADPTKDQKQGKNSKAKMQARSDFNPKAPLRSIESVFSDFTSMRRNNVDVELDLSAMDRVDQVIVPKVEEYVQFTQATEETQNKLETEVKILNRLTFMRKLLWATPISKNGRITQYNNLKTADLYSLPSLIATTENLGKFSFDDFDVRIKDNEMNIHRIAFSVVKLWLNHPKSRGRYDQQLVERISNCRVEDAFFGDDASVEELVSKSEELMKEIYKVEIPQVVGANTYYTSLPRLKRFDDYDRQVEEFVDWIGKINPDTPGLLPMLMVGATSVVQKNWFTYRNYNRNISQLVPALEGILDETPHRFMTEIGKTLFRYTKENINSILFTEIFDDAVEYITANSIISIGRIFNLTKQPNSTMGTQAQLIEISDDQKENVRAIYDEDQRYVELKKSSHGKTMMKIKEKGLVAVSMMIGMTKKVSWSSIYESRLTRSIKATRAAFLSTDAKTLS